MYLIGYETYDHINLRGEFTHGRMYYYGYVPTVERAEHMIDSLSERFCDVAGPGRFLYSKVDELSVPFDASEFKTVKKWRD